MSLDVAPIDVLSADEIGQVARAFDQVHAEAVRLAGNEAMLPQQLQRDVRQPVPAQPVADRAAGADDRLPGAERGRPRPAVQPVLDGPPGRPRCAGTRRTCSCWPGTRTARKWSAPVPLANVARAADRAEIEQYRQGGDEVQPGISVTGQAVSDVVHLLAEIDRERHDLLAPRMPRSTSRATELRSGGRADRGQRQRGRHPRGAADGDEPAAGRPAGASTSSVSRHMGLFAVARLAERHGVRVRLRARSPRGLIALVWLPDSVTERGTAPARWSRKAHRLGKQSARPAPPAVPAPARTPLRTACPQAACPQAACPRAAAAGGPSVDGGQTAIAVPPAGTTPCRPCQPCRPGRPCPRGRWGRRGLRPGPGFGRPARARPGGGLGGARTGSAARGPPPRVTADHQRRHSPADPGWRADADGWAEGKRAAQIVANPVRGDQTAAGLPVRVPRANLIPGSAAATGPGTARPAAPQPARRRPPIR